MCTAHREPCYSSITTIGTTFHIQHRSIQTKVNTAPHTTTQELKTPSAQRSASNTEAYRQKSTPHPTLQPKNSKLPRHNVPHPTPKHTDKTPSAQRSTSNTEAYRQKSTPHPTPQPKNSKPLRHNVPHPIPKHTDKSQHRITHHNPRTLKKKPEGCAEGPWLYGPFAVFPQLPKAKKTRPSAKKIKTKPKPNHTINKEKE